MLCELKSTQVLQLEPIGTKLEESYFHLRYNEVKFLINHYYSIAHYCSYLCHTVSCHVVAREHGPGLFVTIFVFMIVPFLCNERNDYNNLVLSDNTPVLYSAYQKKVIHLQRPIVLMSINMNICMLLISKE